ALLSTKALNPGFVKCGTEAGAGAGAAATGARGGFAVEATSVPLPPLSANQTTMAPTIATVMAPTEAIRPIGKPFADGASSASPSEEAPSLFPNPERTCVAATDRAPDAGTDSTTVAERRLA